VHIPAQTTAGSAVFLVGRQAGEALFTKLCAGCHTIGRGDRAGPDLSGVTQRRERAWLTEFIGNPAKVRARKDPVTVALAAKFPGVRMPFLGLSETDAGDLISYIEAETARRSAAVQSQ
jgi:protein SCO1